MSRDELKFDTLEEVAERFRVTPRRLREHLRLYPVGRKFGRKILFTPTDIGSIAASLETVAGKSLLKRQPTRNFSMIKAHSSDATLLEALRLAREKPPNKK